MTSKKIILKIKNKLGVHARPASVFVRLTSTFISDITIEKAGESVSGKSLIGILMLAAEYNSSITITATGKDCAEAIIAIEDLVNNNLEFNKE